MAIVAAEVTIIVTLSRGDAFTAALVAGTAVTVTMPGMGGGLAAPLRVPMAVIVAIVDMAVEVVALAVAPELTLAVRKTIPEPESWDTTLAAD